MKGQEPRKGEKKSWERERLLHCYIRMKMDNFSICKKPGLGRAEGDPCTEGQGDEGEGAGSLVLFHSSALACATTL